MRVSATYYGIGPNGSNRNVSGSCGQALTDGNGNPTILGRAAFAELGNGHALGGLPCGTQVHFAIDNGPSLLLTKADIGEGGPGSPPKAIDIWEDAAKANGLDLSQGVWVGEATVLGVGTDAFTGEVEASLDTSATTGAASTGGVEGTIASVMDSSLGALLGGKSGESVAERMGEIVIRGMLIAGGSVVTAIGLALFLLKAKQPESAVSDNPFYRRGKNQLKDYVIRNTPAGKATAPISRTGTSTKDVRPLVPGGSTTAAERLAGTATEAVETGAVLA